MDGTAPQRFRARGEGGTGRLQLPAEDSGRGGWRRREKEGKTELEKKERERRERRNHSILSAGVKVWRAKKLHTSAAALGERESIINPGGLLGWWWGEGGGGGRLVDDSLCVTHSF